MMSRYNSFEVFDDFCNMRNKFQQVPNKNKVKYDNDLKVWKIQLGNELFFSCTNHQELILDSQFQRLFKGNKNVCERTIIRK